MLSTDILLEKTINEFKSVTGSLNDMIHNNNQKLIKQFDDLPLPSIMLFIELININKSMVEELKLINANLKEIIEKPQEEGGEDNGKLRVQNNKKVLHPDSRLQSNNT